MTVEDASTREGHADDATQQAAALTSPVEDQHHLLPATVDAMPDPTDTDHPAGEDQAAENSANESPA